jgi:hypothetical protein
VLPKTHILSLTGRVQGVSRTISANIPAPAGTDAMVGCNLLSRAGFAGETVIPHLFFISYLFLLCAYRPVFFCINFA